LPPIGRPISNTTAHVLDRFGRLLPPGLPGELLVGGLSLARGYLDRPDLTAERFLPDPFSDQPGARLYRTGDRVRWLPSGQLEFLGRLDAQVKLRGFRVEPGEVEAVLAQHPSVRDAVVVVREDRPGDKRLVAYVVVGAPPADQPAANPREFASSSDQPTANLREHASPAHQPAGDLREFASPAHQPAADLREFASPANQATTNLREFLRSRLPAYMVPSAIVALPALPVTPNGKVDRAALPAPGHNDAGQDGARTVAPRNAAEAALAAIWCDVLGLTHVGVHDDFFQLGGHSLLATQIASRVRDGFGVDLSLRKIFESPTIAGLASVLSDVQLANASDVSVRPAERIKSKATDDLTDEEVTDLLTQLLATEEPA
jgi:hypothetical protein